MTSTSNTHFLDQALPKGFPILAPVSGRSLPLKQCSDSFIANGILGSGIILHQVASQLFAPVNAVVDEISPFSRWIKFTIKPGVNLLLCLGEEEDINYLDPKLNVSPGAKVKAGQLLMSFDCRRLRNKGNFCALILPQFEALPQSYARDVRCDGGSDIALVLSKEEIHE